MRGFLDRVTRSLTRLLVAVFYREAQIDGRERVPLDGPVLFVANHGNALVDPMVLVALLPRVPRFLAKHTLFGNPAVRPLLSLAGSIPVYRAQDGGTSRNSETFARCYEELVRGGAIALFPEGISHDQPGLQPLRTGAARIALGARARGAEPMTLVPIGLTFEEKGIFRSRLLVTVGRAIVPSGDARDEDPEAVQALTARIDAGLRDVTLNFPSWQAARRVERAAEIYAGDDGRPLPGRPGLAERFSLRRAFGEGYHAVRAAQPARVEALEGMAERYERLLASFGLRDDHVTAGYPWHHALGYVGYRVPELLLRLPFAAVGAVLNYLPYRLPGWVASRVESEGDQPATYKVLTGMVAFPLFWALECALAWRVAGGIAAAATAVAAPVTGWIALRFHERNESFWSELRAWLTLRIASHRAAELRALRRMIRGELATLVEEAPRLPARRDPGGGDGEPRPGESD